ncbi:Ig-like domain-containing protein [Bacillus smithii]|uniref:Ig-like domain-containing protein n=1 Tax=Bacillus smithii TaxID=1479 RepID=UPI003D1E0971
MAYQPKSYRKFVATAATATLVATAVTPAFAAENLPFNDVNKNYEKAVSELYSKGIVKGVSKTEFGTYKTLKRGDAAVIIARALNLDTKNAPDAGFKDVNSSIKGAVNALVAKGIISGVSKDKFNPDAPLTRGQMAKILVNAYPSLKDKAKETPFTDLTAGFKPYIEALYGAGIAGGTSKTTYGTNQNITRGDFAKLLYKAMNFEAPKAESIKAIDDITVDEGTKLEDVKLPEKVTVVYSDKSEKEASVKWDKSKVDTSKPGTYKVEGTVDGTNLTASVNVVVKEVAKAESIKPIDDITVDEGTKLKDVKLPEKVTVVYSDKSEKEASVKWDTSKVDTSKPGTYKVEGTVDGTKLTASVNVVVKAVAPKVESVSAVNSKTLEVKFSKPVDDTKAKFNVKRGSVTANVSKVTWSEDKKAVQLELASKLFAGDYTVNVTGLTDQALTGSVKVENEKVAKIEISSENAILASGTNPTSVTVGYKVYNQYNEDITSKTTLQGSASSGSLSFDSEKGIVTISGLTSPKAGDKLSLTLVHPETATTATKVLTVSESSKVSDITIKGIYNADNKELSEDTKAADFYLLVDAKDQYGNALKASDLNNNVVVNSSNPLVVDAGNNGFVDLTIDGKKQVALKLNTASATAGKSTISIITLANGKVAQQDVEVKEAAKVDTLTLSQPEIAVAGEKVEIPFEAYDQQGNKVDKKELLDAVSVKANGAGLNNATVPFVKDAKTGEVKLLLDLTSATSTGGKVTLTAITPTQKVVNLVVDVKEIAKPTYISATKDVVTNVQQGESLEIGLDNLVVKDQYDRDFDLKGKLGTDNGKYQVIASNPTKSTVLKFAQAQSGADLNTIAANTDKIKVTGLAKGTETLTIKLAQVSSSGTPTPIPGSEIDLPVRVAAADEYVSYEVKPIDPLYDDSAVDGPEVSGTDNDTYERSITVYGVLPNGQKVVLPASAYTVTTDTKGVEVNSTPTEHKINVEASKAGTTDVEYAKDAKEAKGTVTITINSNGKQLTQDFTITQAKPKVASVEFVPTNVTNGVANVSGTNHVINASDLFKLFTDATVKDQYGETVNIDPTTGAITFADRTTAKSTILISDYTSVGTANTVIDGNGTANATIASGADDNESFKATFNLGGYQVPVKVKVH